MCISNELLKNKLISLFLVRILILKKAYSSLYTAAKTAVFEAVNMSGMIWAQWFLLAEWNLISAEHSLCCFYRYMPSAFLKASQTQKTNFVPGTFPYVRNC